MHHTSSQLNALVTAALGSRQCSICYETFQMPTGLVITRCAHLFCTGCLATWVRHRHQQDQDVNCPLCRREVTEFIRCKPGPDRRYPIECERRLIVVMRAEPIAEPASEPEPASQPDIGPGPNPDVENLPLSRILAFTHPALSMLIRQMERLDEQANTLFSRRREGV